MLKNNIETFLECDKEYNEAEIVLFGAPFDSTTSFRPGTRFGSSAVRHESYGLESYSPYQDKDLRDCKIMDSGDLELSFGNTKAALTDIYHRTALILKDKKLPFMVGGEHLVTLGAFRAVWEQYPEVCIIHFDAHADLREEYLDTKLSHACVLRRCWEMTGDGKIYLFGFRSGDREEFYWAKEHVKMQKFSFDGLEEALEELKGKPVYFTVDLDVMDPSVFPGTGTPEPGGVSFDELRKAATLVCDKGYVIGCEVNELRPYYDQSGASTAVAGKIIREMLLALSKK